MWHSPALLKLAASSVLTVKLPLFGFVLLLFAAFCNLLLLSVAYLVPEVPDVGGCRS